MRRIGLWLGQLIRRRSDHRWLFGVTVRQVTFADHRSGTAAIQVTIGCGPWDWIWHPLLWEEPRRFEPHERIMTLREKLAINHPEYRDDKDDDG